MHIRIIHKRDEEKANLVDFSIQTNKRPATHTAPSHSAGGDVDHLTAASLSTSSQLSQMLGSNTGSPKEMILTVSDERHRVMTASGSHLQEGLYNIINLDFPMNVHPVTNVVSEFMRVNQHNMRDILRGKVVQIHLGADSYHINTKLKFPESTCGALPMWYADGWNHANYFRYTIYCNTI